MTDEVTNVLKEYFRLEATVPDRTKLRQFIAFVADLGNDQREEFAQALEIQTTCDAAREEIAPVTVPKRRGRPPASKNKPKEAPVSGN